MFTQIQHYFDINCIYSDIQHACKEGYSTCTALAALTDDWSRQIDRKQLVGVFLDFNAAFDHELLFMALSAYDFEKSFICFVSSYVSNKTMCYV